MGDELGVAKVRRNGQVTVVKDALQFMNAKEGDFVGFYKHPEGVLITKVELIRSHPDKRK
jgi:bifunctional DNA-binding transcriptional regulator/antitoxin component of YhaV-PrlF toxin-antitoxin module